MTRSIPAAVLALLMACGPSEPEPDVVRSGAAEVASDAGSTDEPSAGPAVLFLGTSLTAGYGLEHPDDGFPERVMTKIDSAGLGFRVVNGGVSGDTSAGGLARLDWLLEDPIAVLVLELGANDALRGHDPEALRANLTEIIRRTRAVHPDVSVILAGMEAPPNLGTRYVDAFRRVFSEVSVAEDTGLIPFLLDGVAGVPELNQSDGIHPTAEGHRMIAARVWDALEPVLRASSSVRDKTGAEQR